MYRLVFLFAIFFITACGGVSAAEYDDDVLDVCELSRRELPVPLNETQHKETSPEGFSFEFRNIIIHMNQNMAEVIAAVGEPLSIHETPSCAFDGFDRIFIFPGVQFHTYPIDDEDFVQIISIWDDGVTTREGIRLGSSWDSVVAAYGTDYVMEFSMVTFTRENTTLSFFIEDESVVEISYALIMD